MPDPRSPLDPGLPGDPVMLNVMTEIDIIAHLAETEFQRLLPDGITPAQYGVLNRLLRIDGTETVSELAAAFQVAQPTMSSTVRKLEDKSLVELIQDTDDRRVKRVRVTRKGRAVRQKAVKALEPYWREFADAAPETDWARVLPMLTRLRAFLDDRR